jgi:hypothetical protein
VEVGGIEVDVRVTAELQGTVQEGLHLGVEALADAADLRFGDAALAAQGGHQLVHLAGGDTGDVGLHHHRPQGPIHPAAGFQQRGEEAAGAEAWDAQLHVASWPGQQAITAAVAVTTTLGSAFVTIGTEGSCRLGLDQGLQPLAHQFRDQLPGGATAEQLRQLAGGRIGNGHGLVSGRW